MILGRVIGNVVSVIKDGSYRDFKLLVVQELNLDGSYDNNFYVSADLIGVGTDEVVLVTVGTSSRATKETFEKPIDSVIIAKIDKLIFENSEIDIY